MVSAAGLVFRQRHELGRLAFRCGGVPSAAGRALDRGGTDHDEPDPAVNLCPLAVSRAADGFDGLAGSQSESGVAVTGTGPLRQKSRCWTRWRIRCRFGAPARSRRTGPAAVVIRLTPVANFMSAGQVSVTLLPKMRWLLDEMTVSTTDRARQSDEKLAAVGGECGRFGDRFPVEPFRPDGAGRRRCWSRRRAGRCPIRPPRTRRIGVKWATRPALSIDSVVWVAEIVGHVVARRDQCSVGRPQCQVAAERLA